MVNTISNTPKMSPDFSSTEPQSNLRSSSTPQRQSIRPRIATIPPRPRAASSSHCQASWSDSSPCRYFVSRKSSLFHYYGPAITPAHSVRLCDHKVSSRLETNIFGVQHFCGMAILREIGCTRRGGSVLWIKDNCWWWDATINPFVNGSSWTTGDFLFLVA